MIKKFKTVLIFACGIITLYSCDNNNDDAKVYRESFSVIKSNGDVNYFSSDEGINLFPTTFDPKWGEDRDRVIVGFHYNPAEISSATDSLNINVEKLIRIPTSKFVLPPSADTVETGKFLYDANNNITTTAWVAQNYLTVRFWLKYTDDSKHSFGFIEETELYKHDTLFIRLWHDTEETNETKSSYAYTALDLNYFSYLLNHSDSAVISLKYNALNPDGTSGEKANYVMYHRETGN
jgi:hypothetical protein